jgi:hypothetical protein
MDEAKLKEVFSDEAFVKELLELDAPEEVQAKLADKGVALTLEETKALGSALVRNAEANGELDEDALEDVAGGSTTDTVKKVITLVSDFHGGMTNPIGFAIQNSRRSRW